MALTFSNINTDHFYPFTQTRNIEDIRIGILTIRQKHELLNTEGETNPLQLPGIIDPAGKQLNNVTDIVKLNDWSIRQDFALITREKISPQISSTNKLINAAQIFIEEGATVEHCLLNAAEGPIYIAKNALVMEGCMLRGPIAICENAVVKMGTKIYGGTTIGPYCTAGGEIKNTILSAFSNKAHDGYLGDSIIGEWCNLGAGTSNSNIKNTVGNIRIQLDTITIDAGTKFGLIMGDYSRAAINTSFNTGTVVGVCCNVFAEGLTPKYIPDFSWGCTDAVRYELPKAFTDIDNWKKLKGQHITEEEKQILTDIYKK
jgi:UDP-N-acetylglucosamine diphosphorylase / glucose-1-phosphate thymidylyltransferase / UDP-N-acetylgalactosamine diphosphorylase / glucosamine-1-phosphate N-acetyltransferase / galactosamine-1-phosphate N-acetyltransferase